MEVFSWLAFGKQFDVSTENGLISTPEKSVYQYDPCLFRFCLCKVVTSALLMVFWIKPTGGAFRRIKPKTNEKDHDPGPCRLAGALFL